MKKSVSIIAGGYLGHRLAKALNQLKYSVQVSYRNNEPKQWVSDVEYVHFDLRPGELIQDNSLFNADVMVICLPPGFKKGLAEFYPVNIKTIVEHAYSSGVQQVVFTSSTGIYPKQGVFDESSDIDLTDVKANTLYQAEQSVLNSGLKYKQVIRLAGLFGSGRHPGQFRIALSEQNANERVNMVMIDDAVAALTQLIIEPNSPSQIYNLVAPQHPTKQSFYRYYRQQLAVNSAPLCTGQGGSLTKLVSGERICAETGFNYCYPDLLNIQLSP